MFGFVLPHTVKFKVPGMLFFRRVHCVSKIVLGKGGVKLAKFNGGWVAFPEDGAVLVVGKKVKVELVDDGCK